MTAPPKPGAVRRDAKGVPQVWVPAGSFTMGSSDAHLAALQAENPPRFVAAAVESERSAHRVTLTHGYWIDRTEVTHRQFRSFVDAGGYRTRALWSEAGWAWLQGQKPESLPRRCPADQPDHPIACVTWYEAEAFARWRGGRLPTEAQWEFAARGPESRLYPWGDTFDEARCNVVGTKASVPVGSFPSGASWVGALDMAGNLMEWVQDWLAPHAPGAAIDPTGPATGRVKVEKGGWWGSNRFVARCAYRHFEDPPDYADEHIGFRVVSG